jgi:diadenosine tetraphosphatase ApaH/serine/threonine PP2A family protein phosphatase
MTWAFFSDIHGNQEALEAVAADFNSQGVTRSFFLGDAVGYGASPNECLEILAGLTEIRLAGNHDEAVMKDESPYGFNEYAKAAVLWTRSVLTDHSRAQIASFVMEYQAENYRLVHSSPDRPSHWDYILEPFGAELAFAGFTEPLCLIGHTHQPLIFKKTEAAPCVPLSKTEVILESDGRYLVNVGSVGQPRDGDPRACYAIYDPDARRLSYRRVSYDIASAQKKIRQANLPSFLATRLEVGR